MADETDSGGHVDPGAYIEHSPFYLLFQDPEVMSVLLYMQEDDGYGWTPQTIAYELDFDHDRALEILQFLTDIELVLEHPMGEDMYELNQHHELNRALQSPHMDRVVGKDAIAGVLECYLGKTYLPCIPMDSLQHLTGFSEPEIDEANTTLRRLRVIRSGMVMEATKTTGPDVERAETLVEALTEVIENADDETITLETGKFDDLLHGRPDEDRDDRDDVFLFEEDQFREAVHMHATLGAPSLGVTDSMFTFDGGETGHTLNKQHDAAKFLYQARVELLRHCDEIQEWYNAVPDHVQEQRNRDAPFTQYRPAAHDPDELVEKLDSDIDTYFENTEAFAENLTGHVLLYFDSDDTDAQANVRDAAANLLPDGYTVEIEHEMPRIPESVPDDDVFARLRVIEEE